MFKVTTKIIAIVPFALQYILTKSSRKYSLKYDEILNSNENHRKLQKIESMYCILCSVL